MYVFITNILRHLIIYTFDSYIMRWKVQALMHAGDSFLSTPLKGTQCGHVEYRDYKDALILHLLRHPLEVRMLVSSNVLPIPDDDLYP